MPGLRSFGSRKIYTAFLALLREAIDRVPVCVLASCLMPTHFHLVLWPKRDGDLSRFLHWLLTAHVRRYDQHHQSSGHVWQGRFKAFPIQQDEHLLTVLRYIERNPLRAGLVARAEEWRWSSLRERGREWGWLSTSPVSSPPDWAAWVHAPMTDAEVDALRQSVNRGTPFGADSWVRRTARRLGLESSLNPRGRPRGQKKK
ncbi:MAG: transposase [Nitrospira sp.]|nr:transposase [Nitrospira sp.]